MNFEQLTEKAQELIDMANDYQCMMEEGHERVYEGEDPDNPELTELHNQAMNKIQELENICKKENIDICKVFANT